MSDTVDQPVCHRCGQPVPGSRDDYELIEGMHWECFHFAFEHDLFGAGPEEPCAEPHCPNS